MHVPSLRLGQLRTPWCFVSFNWQWGGLGKGLRQHMTENHRCNWLNGATESASGVGSIYDWRAAWLVCKGRFIWRRCYKHGEAHSENGEESRFCEWDRAHFFLSTVKSPDVNRPQAAGYPRWSFIWGRGVGNLSATTTTKTTVGSQIFSALLSAVRPKESKATTCSSSAIVV